MLRGVLPGRCLLAPGADLLRPFLGEHPSLVQVPFKSFHRLAEGVSGLRARHPYLDQDLLGANKFFPACVSFVLLESSTPLRVSLLTSVQFRQFLLNRSEERRV